MVAGNGLRLSNLAGAPKGEGEASVRAGAAAAVATSAASSSTTAVLEPGRTERLEATVEPFAAFAIFLVAGVAEREDCEPDSLQLGRTLALEKFEEGDCRLRRITLAMGAGDEQDILLFLQAPNLVAGDVE